MSSWPRSNRSPRSWLPPKTGRRQEPWIRPRAASCSSRARTSHAAAASTSSRAEATRRPSLTPGAQHDVGDVRVVGRWVDARLDRVELDREVLTEQSGEVVDADVVRRIEALRLHVLAMFLV